MDAVRRTPSRDLCGYSTFYGNVTVRCVGTPGQSIPDHNTCICTHYVCKYVVIYVCVCTYVYVQDFPKRGTTMDFHPIEQLSQADVAASPNDLAQMGQRSVLPLG